MSSDPLLSPPCHSSLSPSLSVYLCTLIYHVAVNVSWWIFFSLPHLQNQVSFSPHSSQFSPYHPPQPTYLCLTLLLLLAVCLDRTLMWNRNKNTKNKNGWAFVLLPDLLIYPEVSGFQSDDDILKNVKMWEAFLKLMLLDYHRNLTQGVSIFILWTVSLGFIIVIVCFRLKGSNCC